MKDTAGTPLHYKSNNKFQVNMFHTLNKIDCCWAEFQSDKEVCENSTVGQVVYYEKQGWVGKAFDHAIVKRLPIKQHSNFAAQLIF